eukprot:gnl/Chilomastix_caulleri/1598.p1 GENE.gnl/Chilomastix_caulleri/1598~~gnl/Chilomastix_caulleri/1598.p1  ORF type:complete len:59 (+),score=15.21 gnl/Chilomastix_caulleri/1598:81-257(+)
MRYIEASAKSARNVDEVFYTLAEDIAKLRREKASANATNKDAEKVDFVPVDPEKKKCC